MLDLHCFFIFTVANLSVCYITHRFTIFTSKIDRVVSKAQGLFGLGRNSW